MLPQRAFSRAVSRVPQRCSWTPLRALCTPIHASISWSRPLPTLRSHSQTHRRHATTASASSSATEKPYYITTPIFYVNAPAHVGHLYTMVLADVAKRWQVLKGRKAILCTGVDEHGLKIQKAAEANGMAPLAFCNIGADNFKSLAIAGNIAYDHFVRTSDQDHKDVVQYVWRELYDRGFIYRAKHEGWYSVSDETFYPESQIRSSIDPATGRKFQASIETGKEVEWASEENYHFRLSEFQNVLLSHYRHNPGFVTPPSRMAAICQEIEAGLPDLSISRPAERLKWGVPVPHDDSQTIYVWLDALTNYLTKAGYPWQPGKDTVGGWPADCQVIGKDITRFHCIYWPAFLFALGLPLPTRILTHGHWTLGRKKMSKSEGNVVNPFFSLDRFGVDVVRFFMIHDGGVDYDPEYNNELLTQLYKDVLQSVLGNLTSRVVKSKYWDLRDALRVREKLMAGMVPNGNGLSGVEAATTSALRTELDQADRAQLELVRKTAETGVQAMDKGESRQAVEAVVAMLRETGKYFHNSAPWNYIPKGTTLAALLSSQASSTSPQPQPQSQSQSQSQPSSPTLSPKDRSSSPSRQEIEKVQTILFLSMEALRVAGLLLQPTMPTKSSELLDMLGVPVEHRGAEYVKLFADGGYGSPFCPTKGKQDAILFLPLITEE